MTGIYFKKDDDGKNFIEFIAFCKHHCMPVLAYKTRGIHGFLEEILQKKCKQNKEKNESKWAKSFI